MSKKHESAKIPEENRDPITGTKGAHPVGTGAGAAAGGAAGAAIGAVGGPIGAGVGIVAGAVAGGLAGKEVAEEYDPTIEDGFWEQEYRNRPYVESGMPYAYYRPAYRVGYEGYVQYPGMTFEEAEPDLRRDFESGSDSDLTWEKAKHATREAWERLASIFTSDDDDEPMR